MSPPYPESRRSGRANPPERCGRAEAPPDHPRGDRSLRLEESHHLLEAARGDRLEALYVLALNTSMRQGELVALKWDDVDLEDSLLRVRRTLTHADTTSIIG